MMSSGVLNMSPRPPFGAPLANVRKGSLTLFLAICFLWCSVIAATSWALYNSSSTCLSASRTSGELTALHGAARQEGQTKALAGRQAVHISACAASMAVRVAESMSPSLANPGGAVLLLPPAPASWDAKYSPMPDSRSQPHASSVLRALACGARQHGAS
jgi:hypothetical protein